MAATDVQDAGSTLDPAEVEKFSRIAAEWWDPFGKFRPLHKFNPARLAYIRDAACAHFARERRGKRPLEGLRLLDVGCGGGLVAEPMRRLGAEVVGLDASERNIAVASTHARQQGLDIDYRAGTIEALLASGEAPFDIVLNLEAVEHVADPALFLSASAQMVKPGGLMFIATINRTPKAFALAIVGAEYVLGWLPKGTHSWDKFVTPAELDEALAGNGMHRIDQTGVFYNVLMDQWRPARDMDVNYMILAAKPA